MATTNDFTVWRKDFLDIFIYLNLFKAMMPTVKSILILDADGGRIATKYFDKDYQTLQAQHEYEKTLYQKTCKTTPRTDGDDGETDRYFLKASFCSRDLRLQ